MERKLAAIFSTDVHGYSRLMGENEEATIRTLMAYREVMTSFIQQHRGRVVDSPGDNLLAEFASAVDAVQGAAEIQQELTARNAALPAHRRMEFRIGINVGDVIVEGALLYGDGVNIAARLEGLAEPGGICVSGTVYDQIENKLALDYEYLGERAVKNIAKPVRVYRVRLESKPTPPSTLSGEQPARLPLPDKPSLAVLPFANMSGDPEQEYFSDGITEDLITDLSKLSGLLVIARHSVFTYKGQAVKVQDVSRELGVRYVLEGSVRKAANRVRITAQLADTTTGHHVWAERYDRELSTRDIFAVQDEITQQIGTALKVELQEAELERVRRIPTDNLTAYDARLRGEEYFDRFTNEANTQARQLFERAIELDPQYAAAYAMLAWTYLAEFLLWNQESQRLEQAFATAQRAVALDDCLPAAHMTLGDVYLWRQQPEQALAEAERAIALDPNFAEGYAHLGLILNTTGRPVEARERVEQALRLSPRPPFYYLSFLGESHLRTGRYEEAIAAHKQALLRNPHYLPAHAMLAESYVLQWTTLQTRDPQTLERALESAQKVVTLSESLSWGHSLLARVYLWKRQHEPALAQAEQAIALEPNNAESYATLACILSYAGQPQGAIEVAGQARRLNPRLPAWYYCDLGRAYRLTGRVEEAIAAQKEALAQDPDFSGPYFELAVLYRETGREEEARTAIVEYRKRNPTVSLEILK